MLEEIFIMCFYGIIYLKSGPAGLFYTFFGCVSYSILYIYRSNRCKNLFKKKPAV